MTSCRVSDALIVLPHTHRPSTAHEQAVRPQPPARWAVFFDTLSHPSPGRTMDQAYTAAAKVVEKLANRAAYNLGLGPGIVAGKIKSYFGEGKQRAQKLQLLGTCIPHCELEKHCLKLVKYALPTESADTQCQAFICIVELITLFPGLRIHCLSAKCMDDATSTDAISALWDRSTGPPDEQWTYWQSFAACAMSDTTVAPILEKSTIQQLTNCEDRGLNVIEQLLVEHGCATSATSSALCIRYLGGILNLPGFWHDMGSVHADVARKLCGTMIRALKDIGADMLTLPSINDPDPPFDYDGLDFLATTLLIGMSNWLRAEELLPNSFAATHVFKDILPTMFQRVEVNVAVKGGYPNAIDEGLILEREQPKPPHDVEILPDEHSIAIKNAFSLEREERKRSPNAKILLLGQEEAGKSTILKNLQLYFTPEAFQAEAEAWRNVIHLNLVRSVNFVLGLLEIRHPSTYSGDTQASSRDSALSGQLQRLSLSLAPLRQVEETLSNRIVGSRSLEESSEPNRYHPAKASEIPLRSDQTEKAEELQTRRILSACADDIMTLWAAPELQQGLRDRGIVLQEQSGFFLDEVQRVISCGQGCILLAQRNIFIPVEGGRNENPKFWTVYDMGGSTSQRAAWTQFFDDAFNEKLAEDSTVNRLEDSFRLWGAVCSNKLLASVEFILFLNKVDILNRKIQSGVRFAEHVTSYRDRPNKPKEIIKYLSTKFVAMNQNYSPRKRKMHRHVTCAIDRKTTATVIDEIHGVILLNALTSTDTL
ncbi:hypothetical protein MVEN_00928800 [Mycena venus]|uniref:Uncharacterized protein n=1 Tax=Mycena venus TaxID=2733690 RepID=A0A8H6YBM2_9AGAR|nr:hypothetical protein MVEN_00928800 [Mycena venus]